MPLMGAPGHKSLIAFLKNVHNELLKPKAILMISAHWESDIATISSSDKPQMIYDYHGFPPECYAYQYPAAGDPGLAQVIADCLNACDIPCALDESRGYDHGTFVPLMLMYPDADIPVVQLSLLSSMDPAKHIALGKAIALLREQGVLIIGSGMSFHEQDATYEQSVEFDLWLTETLLSKPVDEAETRLTNWALAPAARDCHRREEHLLPLHVCFGAASVDMTQARPAQKIYSGFLFGKRISGFLWR